MKKLTILLTVAIPMGMLIGCSHDEEETINPALLIYATQVQKGGHPNPAITTIPAEGGSTVVSWSSRWYDIIDVREYPGAYLIYNGGYDRENNYVEDMPTVVVPDWSRRIDHSLTWSGDTARGEWFTVIKNDPVAVDTLQSYSIGGDWFRLPKDRQHLATQMLIEGQPNVTGESRVLKLTPGGNAGVYVFQDAQQASSNEQ